MTYESEISGMDSLSRTDNSRWSKNKFKHSQRYNRSGKQRITADFSRGQNSNSQYDESNSHYNNREATNSIGIRTKKSNNQESYYETESQSMESWAAMTPKDGGIKKRSTKESQNPSHINLNDKSVRSPEERSLIINSNSVVSRAQNRGYEESNQKHLQSDIFESSQGANPRTEIRGQRTKGITSDSRTSNKKYKKTPIHKSVKGLPRDHELEDVLSNDQEENTKEVIQRLKETDSHPYVFTSESEQNHDDMHDFEKRDYKSLKIEHNKLRREFKKAQIQIGNYQKQIDDYKAELSNLSSAYVSVEQKMLNYEDELHMLSNFKQGLDTKKIGKLINEDLKRARREISNLKEINNSIEQENHHLKDRLSEFNEMEEYYKSEYDQLDTKFATARIKIESLEKNLGRVGKLESELQNAKDEYITVINQANNEIGKREDVISELKDLIRKKDHNIESLSKQINDNKHLVENDQVQAQQLYNEIQDYKSRVSDLENELEQYKEMPRNMQIAHEKADYDKEISKIEQMYKNKLNSAHEQIDDWKHKCKNEQDQRKIAEKQLEQHLENSQEKETNVSAGGTDKSKYLEVLDQLEQAKEELETLELMKQELDRARKLNDELKEKLNEYANQQSEGHIPDYWQCRLDEKDNDLQRLSDEIVLLQKRYELLESQKWDLSHEKNELLSTISDMKRAIKDRELECDRLNKHRMDAENNAEMLKEASKETLKEKRELERKLNEITKNENYEKSKSNQDYEALKKESNSLIEFILTLEFANDEEFEKLLKNQSYTSDFDRAKKHLKNQKEIVNMITERLEGEYNTLIVENDNYKAQLDNFDSQSNDYDDLKSECQKWKQNYERLTQAMKTLNGSEDKDLKEVMADYKKLQDRLTELQKENARKEDLLKESQDLIEKLQSDAKGKLLEIENQKKISKDYYEKYQSAFEKLNQVGVLEAKLKTLEKENESLSDQNTVLKKTNSEQLKSLSHAPVEMIGTINNLQSNIKKRETEIKQLKAEKDILENLLDEAREELRQNEESMSRDLDKPTFNDALEYLDTLITTPSTSSTSKSKEFTYVLKRAQQIRDQVEQPYITKMMAIVKHHVETDFSEQEEKCTNLSDCKTLLIKMIETYKESNKVSLTTHDDSELLNISTDSRSLRKPYGYKDR